MPPQEPSRTVDRPGHEPAEDPLATTDQSRKSAAVDTNATSPYLRHSFGSTGTTDNGPPGSIVPAIPGYAIEGELGRGGTGVVYRGRQTELHRPVAIKMILGGKYADPVM